MERRKLIVANWKMHKTIKEARNFLRDFKEQAKDAACDIVLCAPFTALAELKKLCEDSDIALGAQNCHFEEKGAYTGEVSAAMVRELCSHVIVGHSERRQLFHEDNETIKKKLFAAVQHGLRPILCVGENSSQRSAGREKEVVANQVTQALRGLSKSFWNSVIIAYEPVWAIGTGNNASPQQAEEMHQCIRHKVRELFDAQSSGHILILYGGSVTAENIGSFLSQPNIDGALVGGASLHPESFQKIVMFK